MAVAVKVLMAVIMVSVSLGGKYVGAQVHHVVGGDRGWDTATDVASWSSGRIFRVGDKIWFTHSAAQGNIAELKTKEEYESCDVSNPIRMYTDGINSVSLDGKGIRYFASSNSENCKNGLKLHVDVVPQRTPYDAPSDNSALAGAAGPTPSSAAQVGTNFALLVAGYWLFYVVI